MADNIHSRRTLLAAAPAAAIAAVPSAIAFTAPSELHRIIEAHSTAWDAYAATLDPLEEARDAYETTAGDTLVPGFHRNKYSEYLGRTEILRNLDRDHEQAVKSVRASLNSIGVSEQTIASAVATADAKLLNAQAGVNAHFDAEDERRATSPLGEAERANETASDAEELAWEALLKAPVRSLADVQRKAAYILQSDRLVGVSLQHADAVDLLQSLIDAPVSA